MVRVFFARRQTGQRKDYNDHHLHLHSPLIRIARHGPFSQTAHTLQRTAEVTVDIAVDNTNSLGR
jgi:hypothetical protein